MIDYEFGPPYEHSELDLSGIWNSTDSAVISFLVFREALSDHAVRSGQLIRRVEKVFVSASAELKTVFELPVAKEGHSTHIQPSELYLEEPTEGVMVIEASGLRPEAEDPIGWCLAAAADLYGDAIPERVRN
ncbi:MAG TPA: hypothetical protein VHA05_01470 [Candidatus Saccharimonadales bacterium]|jgi:hypothetical protein|nr:hypothetical protein [Candidatus Saccharimonadales bacterium]